MTSRIVLIISFLLAYNFVVSQKKISGQVKPKGAVETILMYKTEGAFQYYKGSSKVDENGLFNIEMLENFDEGSYKLVYDSQKDLAVNLFYTKQDISLVFAPNDVVNSIFFRDSESNTLFYDYVRNISIKYDELSVIQKKYYNQFDNETEEEYQYKLKEIKVYQSYFENQSKSKYAEAFIKAFQKPLSFIPHKSKEEKLEYLKENYLNSINFQDSILRNSAFLIDRLNEYVFDLNEAISRSNKTGLDVNMIDVALDKITSSKFKNEVIYSLTNSAFDPYSSNYDIILDHLFKNYYTKLPVEDQNEKFTEMAKSKLNAIIGKKAPDFSIGDSSLFSINSDSTLVIFWSTTCAHCLKEIPKVYEQYADMKGLKVVMIGLEDEYSDWENISQAFPKWTQKRANGKWTNPIAKDYFVKGTPAYFLLDKDKTITKKPEKLVDLIRVLGE